MSQISDQDKALARLSLSEAWLLANAAASDVSKSDAETQKMEVELLLNSILKGSKSRDDFLERLEVKINKMNPQEALSWLDSKRCLLSIYRSKLLGNEQVLVNKLLSNPKISKEALEDIGQIKIIVKHLENTHEEQVESLTKMVEEAQTARLAEKWHCLLHKYLPALQELVQQLPLSTPSLRTISFLVTAAMEEATQMQDSTQLTTLTLNANVLLVKMLALELATWADLDVMSRKKKRKRTSHVVEMIEQAPGCSLFSQDITLFQGTGIHVTRTV